MNTCMCHKIVLFQGDLFELQSLNQHFNGSMFLLHPNNPCLDIYDLAVYHDIRICQFKLIVLHNI